MPVTDSAFRWHPRARLFDGAGRAVPPAETGPALIPDRPSGIALAAALARNGAPFRIGGAGSAPDPGPQPVFETLTGGSTGTPRRIRRTQASWTASFAVNAQVFGIAPGCRTAILGHLVHSLALYGALESLHLGADLHLLDDLRPDRQRAALATRAVDLLYATPAQMRLLAEAPGPTLPLRHLLIGGSKLDPALRAAVQTLAPASRIHEFYGAAEASFITLANPADPADSVGRPYPGVTLQIRHGDTAVPDGTTGEIWVQSPYLFTSYAADSGEARWHDGWLSVSEHGRLQDGHLYLSGRAGRMVKVADQAVYPEQIEAFLLAQPGITRAAVLPRPDALRGHHLVALVQGTATADAALLSALRHSFGPLVAPKSIRQVADWPVLPSGKTDLAALARLT